MAPSTSLGTYMEKLMPCVCCSGTWVTINWVTILMGADWCFWVILSIVDPIARR